MKKSRAITTISIISAFIIIAGVIILAIGFGMGARGMSLYKNDYSFDESISEDIQNIEISMEAGTIRFEKSDGFRIKAEDFNEESIEWEAKNGKLTVDVKNLKLQLVNISFINGSYNPKLTIYFKEEAELNKLDVKIGAGQIDISNIAAQDIKLDCGAGQITGESITAQKSNLNCGAGEISLKNVHFKGSSVSTGAGSVYIEGKMEGTINIENGIGRTKLDIKGQKSEFYIDVTRGIGNVTVDNLSYRKNDFDSSAPNKINANNGIGEVDISFKN